MPVRLPDAGSLQTFSWWARGPWEAGVPALAAASAPTCALGQPSGETQALEALSSLL